LIADRGDAGRRVDLVVRRHLVDLTRATRTRVQQWIEAGMVSVNGRVVRRVSTRAALGDIVTVDVPEGSVPLPVTAEEGPLHVLFEDDHLLVANKPAGIVSHPTFGHPSGSLLNLLLWHGRSWPEALRPSLVSRLDKHTSGAILVAKTPMAHARLQHTLRSPTSSKAYLAVVHGPMSPSHGTIDDRLGRDPNDRRRVIVRPDGVASLTRFVRIDEHASGAVALAGCELLTGRMHQIRVHMAARGWPLVGDAKYGSTRPLPVDDEEIRAAVHGFGRQALHAWTLAFEHPFTGQRVRVEAPPPDDLRRLLDTCGLRLPSAGALRPRGRV
jgi:23S rRNA pseudouridine1911/1915/1917 synthase